MLFWPILVSSDSMTNAINWNGLNNRNACLTVLKQENLKVLNNSVPSDSQLLGWWRAIFLLFPHVVERERECIHMRELLIRTLIPSRRPHPHELI